ncbi:hypothetical protein JCM33374_g3274 [Metschnikowia sp. JCM 33374]|nr:hypothetical protein JCM33374_g3274 [Metschnikowia sp. JCM 33374]
MLYRTSGSFNENSEHVILLGFAMANRLRRSNEGVFSGFTFDKSHGFRGSNGNELNSCFTKFKVSTKSRMNGVPTTKGQSN